jgi:murein DD-endopeptidase MepM/ murein hydrolase activator NlpD
MRARCAALVMGWLLALPTVVAAAETRPTPEECVQHFARDLPRQARCVEYAMRGDTPAAQDAVTVVEPLQHLQLMFGFFDRAFPAFNQGKEHMGVDLAAMPGAPVYAICEGSVAANRTDTPDIVAAVLVVEHDCPRPLGRVFGYYGHIRSTLAPGDEVEAGNVIGSVRDWRGNSHLHLGLATSYVEENWGVVPRGTAQPDIAAQGWRNPWDYFAPGVPAGGLKRISPQAAINRQYGAGDVAGQR